MKVLELFSGLGHISDAFAARGHETYKVDWNEKLDADLHTDISKLTVEDIIDLCGGVPDVVWASPDCTSYSMAAIYRHRRYIGDVPTPKSEYAAYCDYVNVHLWNLLQELVQAGTKYVFVENPRSAYRKMYFIPDWVTRHTVTYCQYGAVNMKPTDIFTNHFNPKLLPACKNGQPCHERIPRGSKSGTQGASWWDRSNGLPRALARGKMPTKLCEHIAKISEEPMDEIAQAAKWLCEQEG